MTFQLTTPVAFFIFNRPDTTFKVFEKIREAKPQKLLIIADGAKFPEEWGECNKARSIIEQIDWNCEVSTNFSEINLGCKLRVSSGLDWVFSEVEEAIILEDDCLPEPSFFGFCQELLEYYRNDTRIMCISGNNFQFGRRRTLDSYYFSAFSHCWGWATWRRAWQYYDLEIKLWEIIKDDYWLRNMFHSYHAIKYWKHIFQEVYSNLIDTWDYQWFFACCIQSGLTILPNVNLVSNIGFNNDATHTKASNHLANIPVQSIDFPLIHPQFIIRDTQADAFTQRSVFRLSLLSQIKRMLKNRLNWK